MTQATIKNKILNLQAQVAVLAKNITKKIDFAADEKVWRKMRPVVKKERQKLFKEVYGRS